MESSLLQKTTHQIQYNISSSELYLKEMDSTSDMAQYLLRIYTPKQHRPGGYPVLVYTHGGGWVLNHIDVYDSFCRKMSEKGFVVVSVGYRKAPENVFPACLNDLLNALTWVGKNLRDEKYNANLNQLTVSGDSAGGHITSHALVRLLMADQEIVKKEQIPKIHQQALFYPALHYYPANRTKFESYKLFGDFGFVLDSPVLEKFWRYLLGTQVSDEEAAANPYFSVMSALDTRDPDARAKVYSKLPGGFVITAEYDILRDEAAEFARVVTEASNGTSTLKHFRTPKVVHGFAQFPSDDMANNFAALIKSFFVSSTPSTTTEQQTTTQQS
ncbi:predicted protein [Naegleria gruberi]|uniref:Predicted protein n=1 Tax=Naegleria gruberi TaxID=5762 RepID=D2VAT7_NAEGR|nr:uncharacterized protein NAEGRDRAFT_48037 [Naegleria gruberi]EFC46137.1 predicted protein [Naegleria gruberi]|eukprot:XP_002678881.1 predicted protein [Naegleria gruberi strain NEG-M]